MAFTAYVTIKGQVGNGEKKNISNGFLMKILNFENNKSVFTVIWLTNNN